MIFTNYINLDLVSFRFFNKSLIAYPTVNFYVMLTVTTRCLCSFRKEDVYRGQFLKRVRH